MSETKLLECALQAEYEQRIYKEEPGANLYVKVNLENEIYVAHASQCMRNSTNCHVRNTGNWLFLGAFEKRVLWEEASWVCSLFQEGTAAPLILRRDISWARKKHSSGVYETFTHFVLGKSTFICSLHLHSSAQALKWESVDKIAQHMQSGPYAKGTAGEHSVLKLRIWWGNYVHWGCIFTIRKTNFNLKARCIPSGDYGEDKGIK